MTSFPTADVLELCGGVNRSTLLLWVRTGLIPQAPKSSQGIAAEWSVAAVRQAQRIAELRRQGVSLQRLRVHAALSYSRDPNAPLSIEDNAPVSALVGAAG